MLPLSARQKKEIRDTTLHTSNVQRSEYCLWAKYCYIHIWLYKTLLATDVHLLGALTLFICSIFLSNIWGKSFNFRHDWLWWLRVRFLSMAATYCIYIPLRYTERYCSDVYWYGIIWHRIIAAGICLHCGIIMKNGWKTGLKYWVMKKSP